MFKYELKIALRKLFKSKLYSLLNILGLTVGLASCLIISTIVFNDLSYDKQWKNSKQVYKIIGVQNVNHGTEETPNIYSGLGPELKRNFPEVKAFCRMEVEQTKIKFDESKEAVNIHALLAENSIWDMLDFTFLEGNPRIFQDGIDNVVITRQIKDQFYKNEDPLGKIIYKVSEGNNAKYLITGVIEDIPENTHLRSQIIVLRASLKSTNHDYNKLTDGASTASMSQYLLLASNTNEKLFEKKLNIWYNAQSKGVLKGNRYYLQPMQDVYLRSNYHDPEGIHGSIDSVYIFSLVAMLILLVACLNYVNLSTAKAIQRMREAAVSRIMGAERRNIISRFMLESALFFLIAFIFAIGAYAVTFGFVKQYLGYPLPVTLFNNIKLFSLILFAFLIICLATGIYPSYMLSKINPVEALKGTSYKGSGIGILKKFLIVTQFSIALLVLIASVTINLQFRYLKNADPGYEKDNLLQIGFNNWGISGKDFKQELLRIPGVESACRTNWYPSYGPGLAGFEIKDPRNQNEIMQVSFIDCDIDFPKTLKIHLKKGDFFDANHPSDGKADSSRYTRVLLSDTYADVFKEQSELEKPIPDFMHIPIGVITDFHSQSFLTKEKPFIITAYDDLKWSAMLIRVIPGSNTRVIKSLTELWKRFYPDKYLTFNWVDDLLAAEYRKESKLSSIFNLFTLLSIFLSCLGLFGMVTITLEKRMKEIGIRKVLGAPVRSIAILVSKDFLKLVMIAILIASPAAWYFLNTWLQHYPYRIDVYWWIFFLAALVILSTTIITISFKTIKAAISKPINSLRTE